MKTTSEYISVNAKYSFSDLDHSKRRIAEMLRDGIDLGLITPELGIFNITGKKVLDLALDRLARDMEKLKKGRDAPEYLSIEAISSENTEVQKQNNRVKKKIDYEDIGKLMADTN